MPASNQNDPIVTSLTSACGFFYSVMRTIAYAKEKKYGHMNAFIGGSVGTGVTFFNTLWKNYGKASPPSNPSTSLAAKAPKPSSLYGKWENSATGNTEWILGNDSEMHFYVTNSRGGFNVFTGAAQVIDGRPFFSAVGTNSVGDYILVNGQLTSDGQNLEVITCEVFVEDNALASRNNEYLLFGKL